MIIDFHTHIGKGVGKHIEDLLRSMDEAKIDKSVVYAGLEFENNDMIKIIEKHQDRLFGVIEANPEDIKDSGQRGTYRYYVETLQDRLEIPTVVGAKFYCGYEYFYANHESMKYIFEILQKVNKPAIFHMGDTYTVKNKAKLKYAQPLSIDEVAVNFPNLKIVIAHVGYPWHRDTAQVMYKNPNVYTDVSGFVYGEFDTEKKVKQFQRMLDEFNFIYDSWDRVLFGTDFPISNQKSYVETMLKHTDVFDILRKNTIKFIERI